MANKRIETVFFFHQLVDGLRHDPDLVDVILGKDRQMVDLPLDGDKFRRADRLVRDGYRHHDRDQRILGSEGGKGIGHSALSFMV
jgi:hypothetical protein